MYVLKLLEKFDFNPDDEVVKSKGVIFPEEKKLGDGDECEAVGTKIQGRKE